MSLGKAIAKARIDASMKQKDLRAATGISQKYLSRIEHDKVDPSWSIIERIAWVLPLDLTTIARERCTTTPSSPH